MWADFLQHVNSQFDDARVEKKRNRPSAIFGPEDRLEICEITFLLKLSFRTETISLISLNYSCFMSIGCTNTNLIQAIYTHTELHSNSVNKYT